MVYDGVYDICSVYRIYNVDVRCIYMSTVSTVTLPLLALYMQLNFRCQLLVFRIQKLTQVDCRQAEIAALFGMKGSTQLGAVICARLFVS